MISNYNVILSSLNLLITRSAWMILRFNLNNTLGELLLDIRLLILYFFVICEVFWLFILFILWSIWLRISLIDYFLAIVLVLYLYLLLIFLIVCFIFVLDLLKLRLIAKFFLLISEIILKTFWVGWFLL